MSTVFSLQLIAWYIYSSFLLAQLFFLAYCVLKNPISHCFSSRQAEFLSLFELVQEVEYPVVKEEKEGLPLVRTWIALLLGEFYLEQHDKDFYDLKGILVRMNNSKKEA